MVGNMAILKSWIFNIFLIAFGSGVLYCDEIQVTLISPEPGVEVRSDEVLLEGLISDLSVTEVKVLVNEKEVEFLEVKNGYFSGKVTFDLRTNRLTLYGASANRRYFRQEFEFVNGQKRERSLEERVPPKIQLIGLEKDTFKILSPRQYSELSLVFEDNRASVIQCGYVLNDQKPVYLDWKKKPLLLKLPLDQNRRSYLLHVFAIDGDGNKTTSNYHFRVEPLKCTLSIGPPMGLYESTPVQLRSVVKGGLGKIKRHYELKGQKGRSKKKSSLRSRETISLNGYDLPGVFRGLLRVVDSNGIDATCESKQEVQYYSSRHPRLLTVPTPVHFESIHQEFGFSVVPPVLGGEVTILLKHQDPQSGFTGKIWKTLGRQALESKGFKRDWKVVFKRRVPPGDYLMKLSFVLHGTGPDFTETIPVVVTRASDDTVDLLEEILRDENQ